MSVRSNIQPRVKTVKSSSLSVKTQRPKPIVLVILDGFGVGEKSEDNAIYIAQRNGKTPHLDNFYTHYPHGLIKTSGKAVGLPEGQMGNSEVGHMNIGAGRIVIPDLERIDDSIRNGSFPTNAQLQSFIAQLKKSKGAGHLVGMLSPGGVHSHQEQITELAKIVADAGIKVYVHAITDGRDKPPKSAKEYIRQFEADVKGRDISIATIGGRYYAMDRDERWDRIGYGYQVMKDAKNMDDVLAAASALEAVEDGYQTNIADEFLHPRAIGGYPGMKNGDGLLMGNFRADRMRGISAMFVDPHFTGCARAKIEFAATLSLTEYDKKLNSYLPAMFERERHPNILADVLAQNNLKSLRIAETEKYAHVTYFFNDMVEEGFPQEKRILVKSPKEVATYDLKPEMSAHEITDKLIQEIESQAHDVIVVNYANGDMVGHCANLQATVKAIQTIDTCLGRVEEAVRAQGGAMLITADHGNAEQQHDATTDQAHTAHTINPVPVIAIAPQLKDKQISITEGELRDIAPTLLDWLGIQKPKEMTGKSLIPLMPYVESTPAKHRG